MSRRWSGARVWGTATADPQRSGGPAWTTALAAPPAPRHTPSHRAAAGRGARSVHHLRGAGSIGALSPHSVRDVAEEVRERERALRLEWRRAALCRAFRGRWDAGRPHRARHPSTPRPGTPPGARHPRRVDSAVASSVFLNVFKCRPRAHAHAEQRPRCWRLNTVSVVGRGRHKPVRILM